jgi:TolB protein
LLAFTTSNDASPEHWEWVVGGPDFSYGDMSFGIGHPTWAPDENRIALTVPQGIAMIERGDDYTERTLLSGQIGDRDPSWSPAGGSIAFVRGGDLWRMDEDGSRQSQITTSGGCSAPALSPDGARVAFEKDGGIWIQDLAPGSMPSMVTEGHRPAWSPNGGWLAFDSNRSGNSDIWVIAFGGGTAVRITSDPGIDLDPTWSADGTTIAYAHAIPNCSCIRTEPALPDYTVPVESRTWSRAKEIYR